MSWQPGQPIATKQDHKEWEAWRRESKRESQRWRRARNPRIDYYPSPEADALIRSMGSHSAGGDFSSIINRIVSEWADQYVRARGTGGVLPPELAMGENGG